MEAHLRNHLSGHSFLVVIDDVWDPLVWESIQNAFPEDENNKSRVIITTRVEQVAKIKGAYVHALRCLNEEESWELFCRKCFQYDQDMTDPPTSLKQLGKDMVAKCTGLPLALVTLGGLLSMKPLGINEWEKVRDNLWDELKKNVHINAVLTLSYKDLSFNLKQCLLYIGIFPEDFEIPISKLMLLWEAENFVGQEEGGRPEVITKSYFNELVGRSLLQKTGEDWHGSTCRIHDLLRDLAINKAKEIDLAFYDGRKPIDLANTTRHRRLCISNLNPATILSDGYINGSLRTFNLDAGGSTAGKPLTSSSEIHVKNLLRSLHKRFSLLRVLDVRVPQGEITNLHVGDMIHLRYLGIDCLLGVELPENIGNLKALQTISIITNKLTLPETMGKLQNLKHMIGGYNTNWIGNSTWIGKLTSLETLSIQSLKWAQIDDTTNLVNLRHLTICYSLGNNTRQSKSKFYSNLESLTRLHTLVFRSLENWIYYDIVFKHCPSIRHFRGRINSYYRAFHEFALNLEVLEVGVDNESCFLSPSIHELPKLRALKIDVGIANSRPMLLMYCSKDEFAQLQTLHIAFHHRDDNNPQMELKVADGGLPLLTNLKVNIPERLIAPDRLKKLITVAS